MSPRSRPAAALLVLAAAASACGEEPRTPPAPGSLKAPAPASDIPADAPLVAFLGDSIAAGIHLPKDRAFPAVLQQRLAAKSPFRLVNAGVSGDTTAGGRSRLDWLLKQKPAIVVVELGANDGFRGVPAESVEANLRDIVERAAAAGAKPLLLGIRIPPNYGADYVAAFEGVYSRVAKESGCAFVPYFMKGVAGKPEFNLPDGIHPTAEGHRLLAENVEAPLRELLDSLAR